MAPTFLESPEDLKWLKDVHGITACAAMLYGNEDAPTRVDAWDKPEPMVWDDFSTYTPDDSGKLTKQVKG
jgi:hypothetical protein